ncbi:MAG: hypothetical protein KGI27_06845 [Thaumarchaeota archaeon]|nr:hypothetical protein [Nitrososphaerota archaeon]
MRKNLHKSKRTQRYGLLTGKQRKAVQENTIDKKMKYKLTNPKTGDLLRFLEMFVQDLSRVLENGELDRWSEDYRTRQLLQKLGAIADKSLQQYPLPSFRLAATNTEGRRRYHLKKADYLDFSERDLKTPSFMFNIFTRGLKQNEKSLIDEYVKKVGYEMPLKEEMEYTWNELKKLLTQKMYQPAPPIPIETKEKINRNIETAWKMIFEKLSAEDIREIIMKTGFGIRLISYSSL